MLLKLVSGMIGMLYNDVKTGVKDGVNNNVWPIQSNSGSSRKPNGMKSAQPSIPPANETLSKTSAAKITAL